MSPCRDDELANVKNSMPTACYANRLGSMFECAHLLATMVSVRVPFLICMFIANEKQVNDSTVSLTSDYNFNQKL